jgi:hypothetical protein
MRARGSCGKNPWGPTAGDLDCYVHRVERTHRDVRLNGADHYLIYFQVAGRSALTQIDQTVQLTAGDVARGTTCGEFIYSLRRASSTPSRPAGFRPASQRDRLRLRLSRLSAFRAKIPQSVWLFAGRMLDIVKASVTE